MPERTIQETVVREAPDVEAFKIGLLESAKKLADIPLDLPQQQIADLSGLEKRAIAGASQAGGIGGYQQIAQGGRETLGGGLGTMGRALGALSYAPGYMDASSLALGRAGQTLGGSYGQFQGGPGYAAQGFGAQLGPAALGYEAGQFQGGPGYAAGRYGTADLGPQAYAAQAFDPGSVASYFNPYEDAAV